MTTTRALRTFCPHARFTPHGFGGPASATLLLLLAVCMLALPACRRQKVEPEALAPTPDYSRQLGPGEYALRRCPPDRLPDLKAAFAQRDVFNIEAMKHSLTWFAAPSSQRSFPFQVDGPSAENEVTHEQARASVAAMLHLFETINDPAQFEREVLAKFNVYESVGYNKQGIVLFTGYYAPIFKASRERTAQFTHPLYMRPADLVTDPLTGQPLGKKLPDGSVVPYETRKQIEQSGMFAGNELVWLEDSLAAYTVHVNGSARLRMTDGSIMYIGYNGKTDRPYASLGRALVERGILPRGGVTMAKIKQAYRANKAAVEDAMNVNESYVFFTEYAEDRWPSGSLGVKVTQETSLATDKKIYPRGGVVLVDTQAITLTSGPRKFLRFMCDQDTGGAINAPGRADIFMGEGPTAEILAGGQYAEGRLYYFFLKPEYVSEFAGSKVARASGLR